ncbi:MAG TPA: hypothetical protein VMH30_03210 [Verrucomicrobiae bacterium]|nr:hypothetical protein [Verrucomicrobiae bacterium]
MTKPHITLSLLLLTILAAPRSFGQGTAFNYQGQLSVSNTPANGSYDFLFNLYAAGTGGDAIAGPVTNTATAVSNGLFTTAINFGTGVFAGGTNWLDIAVRTNGGGAFTELTPRQEILPVPYAIYSQNAGTAMNAVTASNITLGAVTGADIAAGTITAANIAGGQVVKTLNGLSDAVSLTGANGIVLSTNGNTLTISAGIDYGFLDLNLTGTAENVGSGDVLPLNGDSLNGWTFNTSNYSLAAPAAGTYYVQFGGWSYSTTSGTPQIEAVVNGSSLVSGSGVFTEASAGFSHAFIVALTAGETLQFVNEGTSTLVLAAPTGTGTAFSVTITRIN